MLFTMYLFLQLEHLSRETAAASIAEVRKPGRSFHLQLCHTLDERSQALLLVAFIIGGGACRSWRGSRMTRCPSEERTRIKLSGGN
jgi:hypothetical protein